MAKNNRLTPDGTGDRLFEACAAEERVKERLAEVFTGAGYRRVRTPGLEFLSVFEGAGAYFPPEEMYKLSDSEGRLIALRPDSTIPIARLVATKLKGAELPLKLYYEQGVFRRQRELKGRECEIMQMGVELIGAAGFEADVEMVDLAVRSLAAAKGRNFRIEIGHVSLYKRLMARLFRAEEDGAKTDAARIHRHVVAKNYSALEDDLVGAADSETAALLMRLPGMFGGIEALDEAAELFDGYDDEITEMLAYLKRVMEALSKRGHSKSVMIDLGLVNQAEYYSSLVFKGYGESAGEPLLSGGRYDELFCDFGEEMPATGFGVNIDLLTEAEMNVNQGDVNQGDVNQGDGSCGSSHRVNHKNRPPGSRPLRIALTKGRLEENFIAMMEGVGYDMAPMREKGRKLIITVKGPEGESLEVFLAKAADVVTCVEHGVCEVGIVGKDTLLEHGGTYYEIADLGFGKCRFALAAPADGPVAAGETPRVVASKYPQYAGRYFERLGLDVRIIRIEGSVEIAPALGLADSIVDIVETGTTLRENGLDIIRYIRDVSARLIVNVTGMKLRKREVETLASRLARKE